MKRSHSGGTWSCKMSTTLGAEKAGSPAYAQFISVT